MPGRAEGERCRRPRPRCRRPPGPPRDGQVGQSGGQVHHLAVVVAVAGDHIAEGRPRRGARCPAANAAVMSRAMAQPAAASSATNMTSSPMCLTMRPLCADATSNALSLESADQLEQLGRGRVQRQRGEPDQVDEADGQAVQGSLAHSGLGDALAVDGVAHVMGEDGAHRVAQPQGGRADRRPAPAPRPTGRSRAVDLGLDPVCT